MKIKSLLMAVVAGAALLVSCEKKEELGPAKLTLAPTALNFEADGGSQNVELTATRAWQVDSKPDWVRLGTENGEASASAQSISVSVEANTGNDRTGSVVFTIGMMKSSLTVTQKGAQGQYIVEEGDGSQEKPFSVAQAADAVKDLTWTSNTEYQKVGPYYVKGKVSSIKENYSSEFGNANFNISDDGTTAGAQFTAYRVKFLGNKGWVEGNAQVAVGDIVVIYGEIMNYKGNTPETVSNSAYLYSLNGETGGEPGPGPDEGDPEGDGSLDNPFNVAAARAAVKDLTWTSNTDYQKVGPFYVKGKICKIANNGTYGESGTFGNATFYISDDGNQGNDFQCYRVLYLGNKKYTSGDDIKVGDDVIIYAELMNYRGNTPETVSNSGYLYSLNGNTGGDDPGPGPDPEEGDPTGDGSLDNPFNVAAARAAVKDLTWTSNTDYQKVGPYYVKGKISKIANNGTYGESGTFGNATFYIADVENGAEFYCYRVLYLGNQKYTEGTDIKVGDEVIIYAELMNYRGNTPETVSNSGYLYSLNGNTGGDDPGPGPDPEEGDPTGDGSLDNPFNVAAARAAVKDLTWTSNTEYEKVGPYYVKGKISKIASKGTYGESGEYGNATFYISDDGNQGNDFQCYRILYLGNQKYTSGTDIKVGDEVIIHAELMNYRGNTPETVSNSGYLYSLNGETDGGEIEPEVGSITVLALRQTEDGFYASWGEYPETDYYYWELTYDDPASEGGVGYAATGYIDSGHELFAIAGQFDEDDTVENAQFWEIDELEDGVEYFFVVYAVQYNPDEEAEFDIPIAVSDNDNPISFVAGGGEPGPGPGPGPGGETVTINVDFTSAIEGFPQENGTKDGTYTLDGYEFKFHAADNFKQFKYDGAMALLIGKKDSYIELPAVPGYSLSAVEFKTGAGASEKVTVDIAKADGTLLNVNTAALKKDTVYTWTVAGEAGAKYRIAVTNANNAQFQYITLTYSE